MLGVLITVAECSKTGSVRTVFLTYRPKLHYLQYYTHKPHFFWLMAGSKKFTAGFSASRNCAVARNKFFSATSVSGEQQIWLETDVLFYVLLFYTFSYTLITFHFN